METKRERARRAAALQVLAEQYRARASNYAGKLRRKLEEDAHALEKIAAGLLCMSMERSPRLKTA